MGLQRVRHNWATFISLLEIYLVPLVGPMFSSLTVCLVLLCIEIWTLKKKKNISYLSQSLWTRFIQGKNCCFEEGCVMWELWVKFYLGQYEDSSLWDSTSDSSENQLQRGRGKGQHICGFGEGGVHAIKHRFFVESFCWSREASASHKKWSF